MSAPATPTRPAGKICLASRRWVPGEAQVRSRLPPEAAQALARLLPMLMCGEDSAEHVFAGAAAAGGDSLGDGARAALRRIADDEARHGRWLLALRRYLPPPASLEPARRAAHFLRMLATDDIGLHLARVAALDGCVCRMLAEISRSGRPLAGAPALTRVFARIRSDEARHVRVARTAAQRLGVAPEALRHERERVQRDFAALLASESEALTTLRVRAAWLHAAAA